MKHSALPFLSLVATLALADVSAHAATGTPFTITNGQTVNTAQSLGSSSGQTGTVNAGGVLTVTGTSNSTSNAITLVGTNTINNSGLIQQTTTIIGSTQGARAIRDNTGGFLTTITNSGTITAAGNDGIQVGASNGNIILTNTGTISATGTNAYNGQALDFNSVATGTNTINNNAGGLITAADADAIRMGANGTIYNDGAIRGFNAPGNSGADGVDAQKNSGITIVNANSNLGTNANVIEGGSAGISGGLLTGAAFTMTITNNSHGTIQGNDGSGINLDGVNGAEVITVTNAGLITGRGVTGDGDGIDVDGVIHLTNTGTIVSLNYGSETSEGVTVGGGSIVNSGLIQGTVTGTATGVGRGVTLAGVDKNVAGAAIPIQKIYTDSTVVNSGAIKGDTSSGIGILGYNTTVTATYTATNYSVTITNTLGGVIEGGGTAAAIDGSAAITVSGTGTASANNETVINYGTIKADGTGKAISLGMGNNSVQIMGGTASVIGDMSGAVLTGTNTAALTIAPTSGQTFNYGGVISNFTSVEVVSGTVNLSGANTYSGSTSIDANALLSLSGSGTIGTTGTLTIAGGGTFDLGGKTVSVSTLANSGTINNGTVNAALVSGLTGSSSLNKTGNSTLVLTGTYNYTGGTTVSAGKLAVNGSITGSVTVQSGAELGGSGLVGGTIGGAGSVGPGNSPGILTASNTDPTGGLTYNFEFTQAGVPTWNNASASGNDVLHLTAVLTPFTAPLTSSNTINLYFSQLSLTFEGGFFTEGGTDTLTANIANALYHYYLLDNANGTVLYNGNKYDLISSSQVTKSIQQISGANFTTGTVNGFTEQFVVAVPEPSTYLLLALGALGLWAMGRKRRDV